MLAAWRPRCRLRRPPASGVGQRCGCRALRPHGGATGRAGRRAGRSRLPVAPVVREVPAPRAGVLQPADVRALGLAVVALGGGRLRPGDRIDPRVGILSKLLPTATSVAAGQPLACVHAASPPMPTPPWPPARRCPSATATPATPLIAGIVRA